MVVTETPSVTLEMTCQTPVAPAAASSRFLATWVSSSPGAAPNWVIVTSMMGKSMLGNRVIGSATKLLAPRTTSTRKLTIAGIGDRIDHAETLSVISPLRDADRAAPPAPHRRYAGMQRLAPPQPRQPQSRR